MSGGSITVRDSLAALVARDFPKKNGHGQSFRRASLARQERPLKVSVRLTEVFINPCEIRVAAARNKEANLVAELTAYSRMKHLE
jgi:hypothetical protein